MMKMVRVAAVAATVVGLGLLAEAGHLGWQTHLFLRTATAVQGEVRALMPERGNNGLLYKPVIAYEDAAGQARVYVAAVASNPPSYQEGEAATLLIAPPPSGEVRLDDFMSLWGGTAICGLIGGVFSLMALALWVVLRGRGRRAMRLQAEGHQVLARITSVELNEAFSMNGRHPWRIVCQWLDPQTRLLHRFESDAIWFDPSPFLSDETMPVWINPNDPREHHMDLRVLPRMAA